MISPSKIVAAALPILILTASAEAYEIGLRYYKIRDHDVAEAIDRIDDEYDDREDRWKDQRRQAGYGTPEHAEATAQLDRLRAQRDREFLQQLETTTPEVDYVTPADTGETVQESTTANGKPLNVEFKLGEREEDKISVEVKAEYDGKTLYEGSALLIPLSTPHVVSKALIKIQGRRQGNLVFVEVRP